MNRVEWKFLVSCESNCLKTNLFSIDWSLRLIDTLPRWVIVRKQDSVQQFFFFTHFEVLGDQIVIASITNCSSKQIKPFRNFIFSKLNLSVTTISNNFCIIIW